MTPVKDIEGVKKLFKQLKRDRKVLNWQEFADEVDLSRTYISRVLNKHEPLTDEFLDKINNAFHCDTETVNNGTKKEPVNTANGDKDRLINALEKQITFLEGEVSRLEAELRRNLVDLKEYGLANNAHLKTLLECLAHVRSKIEKVPLQEIREIHKKLLIVETEGLLKADKH
jgi:transcriptional regulator with XRE-family HTH domain